MVDLARRSSCAFAPLSAFALESSLTTVGPPHTCPQSFAKIPLSITNTFGSFSSVQNLQNSRIFLLGVRRRARPRTIFASSLHTQRNNAEASRASSWRRSSRRSANHSYKFTYSQAHRLLLQLTAFTLGHHPAVDHDVSITLCATAVGMRRP